MNEKNIKLIALDIDGTLMSKDFVISDKVKKTLKHASAMGIKVVLATGRMFASTVPIARELDLKTPIIAYQGGLVKEFFSSDKIYLHHTITENLSKTIISELRQLDMQINLYIDDQLYIENESALVREYADKRSIAYKKVDDFDNLIYSSAEKILAIDESPQKTTDTLDYLKSKFSEELYLTKSMPIYCEIANKKVSKGNAILHLAKYWDIAQSEIMTIGDQDNDIEMISVAGFGVAMGNGTSELKKVANYVTDTVNEDGVATAIEKFVLN